MAANVILDLQLLDLPTAYGLFLTDADLTGYVTLTGVETLTNKTLTSPAINTPTLVGGTINNTPIGLSTRAEGQFTQVGVGIDPENMLHLYSTSFDQAIIERVQESTGAATLTFRKRRDGLTNGDSMSIGSTVWNGSAYVNVSRIYSQNGNVASGGQPATSNILFQVNNGTALATILTLDLNGINGVLGGTTPAAVTTTTLTVNTGALFPYGDAATPGIRFSSDPDTGIYGNVNAAANSIGFSTGGAVKIHINSSGIRAYGIGFQSDVGVFEGVGAVNAILRSGSIDIVRLQNSAATNLLTLTTALSTFLTPITVMSDTDANTILGRLRVVAGSDTAILAHFDQTGTSSYMVRQSASGRTELNSASGQSLFLNIAGTTYLTIDSAGRVLATPGTSNTGFMVAPTGTSTISNSTAYIKGSGGSSTVLTIDGGTSQVLPLIQLRDVNGIVFWNISNAGYLQLEDAGTNSLSYMSFSHNTSGTPAAGFGVGQRFFSESDTTVDRELGRFKWSWSTATDASRVGRLVVSVFNIGVETDVLTIIPTSATFSVQTRHNAGAVVISSSTSTTFLGDSAQEIIAARNSDATANNWTTHSFQNSSGLTVAAIGVQNQASNAAEMRFGVRSTSAMATVLTLTPTTISGLPDTDTTHTFGRLRINGAQLADNMYLAHFDMSGSTNFALRQDASGATRLNAASGQVLSFAIAGTGLVSISTAAGMDSTIPVSVSISQDSNATPHLYVYNANAGTAASANIELRNNGGATADSLRLMATGTAFTTVGGFVQDAGVISAEGNLSGGLSIMTRNASGDIRFYTGGHANLRMTIGASTGAISSVATDTATNTATNVLTLGHETSGTPAASYGLGILLQGESSTTSNRDMARIRSIWTTATDASRVSNMVLSVWNIGVETDVLTLTPTGVTTPVTLSAQPITYITAGYFLRQLNGANDFTPVVYINNTASADLSANIESRSANQTNGYHARFGNTSGTLQLAIDGNANLVGNTNSGIKIGTATSQKFSLWNATPDVQPTTAIVAAAFVANTSGIANDTATFGGYTIGQIVAALKRIGALA